ncbi:MAG: hypothetical protein ABSA30_15170 [Candidatus Aminicenantales bacterium]
MAPGTPALVQAAAAVKARLRLLAQPFDPENTTRLLMDPRSLWAQAQTEAAALKKGLDPFKGRTGDYWRIVKTGDGEIPVRVYAPSPAGPSKPAALVIAFHGAGGDENMFMDGYGAGLIKRLAEKRKFLLVTPLTDVFKGAETGPAADEPFSGSSGKQDRRGRLPVRFSRLSGRTPGGSSDAGRRRRIRSHRQPGPPRAAV